MGANPAGPWSYGWSSSPGSALTAYSVFIPARPADPDAGTYSGLAPDAGAGLAGIAQWYDPTLGNGLTGDLPDVGYNPYPTVQHPGAGVDGVAFTVQPGQFVMWPGLGSQYTVVRWTASRAGTYQGKATFTGVSGFNGYPQTTTDVHVLYKGADLASGNINVNGGGNTYSWSKTITVAPGDVIDFAVGDGGNNYLYDLTGLDALVCATGG
jgi:hypothetical protein